MKFFAGVGHGARTNRLDFGDDPVQDPDAAFLNQDPNPDICYFPAWLINLNVEDISSFFSSFSCFFLCILYDTKYF